MSKNLLIYGLSENPGGVEQYILNCVKVLQGSKYNVFVLKEENREIAFKEEIIKYGGKIVELPISIKNPVYLFQRWKTIMREYDFEIAYLNYCTLYNIRVFEILKMMKIKKYIIHAHSIGLESSEKKKQLRSQKKNLKKINKSLCQYVACSKEAGDWMFGKKLRYRVIKNAIDIEQFKYCEEDRRKMRKKMGIEKKDVIIGTVGRVCDIKNSVRIVSIFNEFYKIVPNAKLIIVGNGPQKSEVEKEVEKRNLKDQTILTGAQKDISRFLQAFDYFLFPSKKEGFGIALLEAQASGLKCLTSSGVVPNEINVTGNVEFKSLNDSDREWAKKMYQSISDGYERKNCVEIIKQSGYSMETFKKQIIDILDKEFTETI